MSRHRYFCRIDSSAVDDPHVRCCPSRLRVNTRAAPAASGAPFVSGTLGRRGRFRNWRRARRVAGHGARARRSRGAQKAGWRRPRCSPRRGATGRRHLGVIYRPTTFDPAGSTRSSRTSTRAHSSFAPKSFSAFNQMQAQANSASSSCRSTAWARRTGPRRSRRRVEEHKDAGFPIASCGTRSRGEVRVLRPSRASDLRHVAGGQNALAPALHRSSTRPPSRRSGARQPMTRSGGTSSGWLAIGRVSASSNVDNAHRCRAGCCWSSAKWTPTWTLVRCSVNALIKAKRRSTCS